MNFLNLLQCACPPAAALTATPADTCIERIGQIQKIMIQRTKDGATVNEIVIGTNNPNLEATWTALKGAAGNTKVVVSPFIANPVNEAGAARTRGGGNASLGGIATILGSEPSTFTAEFHDTAQSVIEVIKKWNCEKGLSVFLINEHGQIIGLTDSHSAPTIFKGVPAYSMFVGDKKLGNYEEVDMNALAWSFFANWSDKLHVVTPVDFDALIDL